MSQPWTNEEVEAIWSEVESESDRGCILLCGAFLDRGLEHLLRLNFHSLSSASDKEIDRLLTKQPLPPLGGFSIRAVFARLMGLIGPDTSKAILELAKIRNKFAHNDQPPRLTKELVQPIIDSIPADYRDAAKRVVARKDFYPEAPSARRLLMIAVVCLHKILQTARERITAPEPIRPKSNPE